MFTGREWDAEVGLYYYRARHYDPRTGRFVSPDPIGMAGDGLANVFRYVGNHPTNGRDPHGLYDPDDPAYGNPVGQSSDVLNDSFLRAASRAMKALY